MKISYLKLLEMMKKGKPPKRVMYNDNIYEWEAGEYVLINDENFFITLSEDIVTSLPEALLATEKVIEIKPKILDEIEKEYLGTIIKPFRNDVKFIALVSVSAEKCFIGIRLKRDGISLPIFKREKMYKGMELNKMYTLHDLEL